MSFPGLLLGFLVTVLRETSCRLLFHQVEHGLFLHLILDKYFLSTGGPVANQTGGSSFCTQDLQNSSKCAGNDQGKTLH